MRSDDAADGKSCEECERLRAENARLVTLLEKHGIPWEPDAGCFSLAQDVHFFCKTVILVR